MRVVRGIPAHIHNLSGTGAHRWHSLPVGRRKEATALIGSVVQVFELRLGDIKKNLTKNNSAPPQKERCVVSVLILFMLRSTNTFARLHRRSPTSA